MDEKPKFDMGLNRLRPGGAFRPDTNLLFAAKGYIWRSATLNEALGNIANELRESVQGTSDEETLQNISKLAYGAFNALAKHGIAFKGEFIVHDVNGVVSLVSAVPEVRGAMTEARQFKKVADWQKMFTSFSELYEGLLGYFDEHYPEKPMLWDISRAEQYVYGNDPRGDGKSFVLVDSDFLYKNTPEHYEKFIRRGKMNIEGTMAKHEARLTSDTRERMEWLLAGYEERYKKCDVALKK